MPPTSKRSRLSLDGTWSFAPDPGVVGQAERWQERSGFAREVSVPSPWQLYGPDMIGYTGFAWYARTFERPADWNTERFFLGFDAVDYEATVWLNGVLLGRHEGGYTPFAFDVTDALAPGENRLVMRVHDPRDNSEIPHGKQGSWYTRVSGPWQSVWLEGRASHHVTALRVTPEALAGRASAIVELSAPDGTPVTLVITDPDGAPVTELTAASEHGAARFAFDVPEPRLWSPETPQLYSATARVGEDSFGVRFGMRDVGFEGGQILLNGQPLYVRGALDQGFWPETVYLPPSLEAIENEIRLAKAMGLNLLRKHIKLEDPRYLDACDRLGMLIWEEPACYVKHTPQARARFKAEIEAMIARDYNHPSIIAWSLYNEEWGLEWRLWRDVDKQEHVEALYAHARTLDATRLLCDNSGWAHVKTDLNDYHRYFVAPDLDAEWKQDLAHCIEQPQTNFVAGKQDNAKGVPVLVSEFGVWGLAEPSRIIDWYGERPWWFDAQWAGHTEEFKYPATAERHFERYGLSRVFGSLDALTVQCQRRMMRALKPIIEAMRQRADLAGYVVTELTDIEWEANGWLDYFRRPKAGFEEFSWFNGPIVVMTELPKHNFWGGEAVEAPVFVSNHTAEAFEGLVRWRLAGHDAVAGEARVSIRPFASERVATLSLTAPSASGVTRGVLVLELVRDNKAIAHNEEELTFASRASLSLQGIGPVALGGEAQALAGALAEAGLAIASRPDVDALLITTTLDEAARAHLAAGGRALFIAEQGEGAQEKGLISFRRLPRGESWDRAASVFYAQPDRFGDLPLDGVLGWEMEGLYPHHVVPISNYLQDLGGRGLELPSNQAGVDPAGVWLGYFEGWLGKFGAAMLTLPYDEGRLTVTTLRLLENYGTQPIGTLLLHRLITLLDARQEAGALG